MSRKQLVFAPVAVATAMVLLLGADQSFGQKRASDPFSEQPAGSKKVSADKQKVSSDQTAEQAIEKALDSPTTLEFHESPLSDVIDYLKTLHNIQIQIDQKALEDAGIGSDVPMTRNVKGISLRSALDLMLRDLDLTYVIHDQVLLITTREKADEMLVTEIYDVADLVVCRDETAQRWDDYGPLVDAITAMVAPQSWDQNGGPQSIRAGTFGSARVLIVSQTNLGQHQIADLLEEIRAIGRRTPSDEPPLRSRPGGMRMGMGGMMGGGMMGGGMMGPGMMGPGMGAKPAIKPHPKKQDP